MTSTYRRKVRNGLSVYGSLNPPIILLSNVTKQMGKRQVKSESDLKEIRLPEEGEVFGRVLKIMGGENVMVKCTDGLTRRGRIRGKLKRRVWIRDNDIVIIAPWDFKETEMGDIVWRFTLPQVEWLKEKSYVPRDF